MRILDKIKTNLQLFWHSIFRGMAAADTVIKAPVENDKSVEIVQQVTGGSVLSDMLQEKKPQHEVEVTDNLK